MRYGTYQNHKSKNIRVRLYLEVGKYDPCSCQGSIGIFWKTIDEGNIQGYVINDNDKPTGLNVITITKISDIFQYCKISFYRTLLTMYMLLLIESSI